MKLSWDSLLAAAYANECLFLAAQVLGSNRLPLRERMRLAYEKHLSGLLDFERDLPHPVASGMRALSAAMPRLACMSDGDVQQLIQNCMALLATTQSLINSPERAA